MSGDPRVLRDELAARVRQALVMRVDTGMGGLEVLTDVYKPEGAALIIADEILDCLGIPADTPVARVAAALRVLEAAVEWAATVALADESKDPRHRTPVTASRRLKNAVLGVER